MDEHTRPHYERSALVTIDLQRDFLSDGAFAVAGTTEVLPNVRRLVAAYRDAGREIVHAVRLYLPDGSNADRARRGLLAAGASIVIPGSAGAELAPALAGDVALDPQSLLDGRPQRIGPHERVLYKPRWNAFYATGLADLLADAGADTVVVAGCNYPNCPRGTLFGASERDLRAVLVTDATSGCDTRAVAELTSIGIATATTDEVVGSLRPAS